MVLFIFQIETGVGSARSPLPPPEQCYCQLVPSKDEEYLVYAEVVDVSTPKVSIEVLEVIYNPTTAPVDNGAVLVFHNYNSSLYPQGTQWILRLSSLSPYCEHSVKVVDGKVVCGCVVPGFEIEEMKHYLVAEDGQQPLTESKCWEMMSTLSWQYSCSDEAGCSCQMSGY
jgi:hypothetical protein